jgi:hypothetical protein
VNPNSILGLTVPTVTIIGLIVLLAMGKVTWGDAGPLIAALAGVHGGAVIASNGSSSSTPTPSASSSSTPTVTGG